MRNEGRKRRIGNAFRQNKEAIRLNEWMDGRHHPLGESWGVRRRASDVEPQAENSLKKRRGDAMGNKGQKLGFRCGSRFT